MPEGRTYTKWKNSLKEEFMEVYEDDISWDYAESFSQKISKLLQGRIFDKEAKNAILYGFYDPLVGLIGAKKKMEDWDDIVTTMEGVCRRPDGSLFHCPENMTTEERLLSKQQESVILLLSILFLHEGLYKSIVNFIYNLTGHGKHKDNTTRQAKYLAEAGLDIRRVSDKKLRNSIAHMTFFVTASGDVLANSSTLFPPDFDAASGERPPSAMRYWRDELIAVYDWSRAKLSELFAVTQHWFNCNYGPLPLFDDAFFETPECNEIQKAANLEMVSKPNVDHWYRVLERAREELQRAGTPP